MIKRKGNKKIRNTQPCEFNGIQFKSLLEKNCYIELRRAGFTVEYEPIKFILFEGGRVIKPYLHYKKGVQTIEVNKKLLDTSWTPDFIITNEKGNMYIFESKGFSNDLFPIKLKVFRKLLETLPYNGIIMVNSKKDCIEAIKWIKNN